MRVGYFGGTFDPFHEGHINLLLEAKAKLKLDRIIVMPAGHPYHKQHDVSLMSYRYGMTRAALDGLDGIEISDIEMLKRGPSYTLETVRKIRSTMEPDDELYLICGLDVVLQIHLWYEVAALLRELKLAIFIRPGIDREQAEAQAERLEDKFQADIDIFDATEIDVSSTELRQLLMAGNDVDDMPYLPKAVRRFIKKHNLYRKENVLHVLQPDTRKQLVSIETDLFESLSLKRLLHSLDTMYYAVELAVRFNVNPDQAALAAIVHDMAREMDTDYLWSLVPDAPERWRGSLAFLHGPAAAALIPERFGITDPEIIRAVALHTGLDEGADDLSKVLFLADKTEPSRNFADLPPIRELSKVSLDEATLACLEATSRYAERSGFDQEPMSVRAEADLRKKLGKDRT